jgi:dTDP-4-amino-4,6-dideoxygalactose transaminase
MNNDIKINVTKTFIPPLSEYMSFVKRAFDNEWLTNRGELVLELEEKLKKKLALSNILITNNGTIPLQIALKLFGKNSEIITTPFSYVATSASIIWENCKPVFVDIDPEYLTINENLIEAAITNNTTCILATHVFGNPCNVEIIEKIASKFSLKVIYDAAHCFGVDFKQKSIFEYGDISTCSFHATKLFHTGEGGAIFCKDENIQKKIFYSHAFGHLGQTDYYGVGINGKISELNAAMGLTMLSYIDEIINERKKVVDFYNENLNFYKISTIKIRESTKWNFSYYPIWFESEQKLLKIQSILNQNNIYPRRYFYPSLNLINYINAESMPISEKISSSILCLPLYVGLSRLDLIRIVNLINSNI